MKATLTKTTRNSLLAMLTGQPLAMSEAGLNAMLAALDMAEPSAIWAKPGDAVSRSGTLIVRDGVAVIGISGPIFAGAGWLSAFFDIADPQTIAFDFANALADPKVDAILLEINSPGGQITGVNELSQMIREARGQKPIVAYVSGSAASAAYWIASGADEIVMEETASAGSIGVIVRYPKASKNDYAVEIISSASPKKRVDPESDAGRAQILAYADTLAEIFLSTVAANRNVSIETAKQDFGQGDVLIGKQAVDAGLADSVGTFEGLMQSLTQNQSIRRTTMDKTAITTIIQLAAAYPDLVAQLQAQAREEGVKSVDLAVVGNDATGKERTRILGLAAIQFGAEATDKFTAVVASGVTVEQFQAITALNPPPAPAAPAPTQGDEERRKYLAALERSGAQNPGPGPGAKGETDLSSLPPHERAKAQWDQAPAIRAEFSGDFEAFRAFSEAEASGKVKRIFKKQ